MAEAWQSAWVAVLPDFKDFKRTANSQMSGILGSAGTAGGIVAGKNLQPGIFGGIKGLAGGVVAAVAALGIGRLVGNAIGTGIRYSIDSVGLASDLRETRTAIGTVFGSAAADIEAFAETANQKLGQTRQSALSGAQTFGIFAKAAGLTGAPLAKFSTDLVTLSGDMASFFNADPSEVIEALGAGLRGESEPLRRFGVLLDDATLKARALNLGIYDGTGALSQQQRVLAAQAEIFAQTGVAQGDFLKTSDGLANQQRILNASLEDTQARLGEYLLPAFTELAGFANTTLVPALGDFIDKVGPKLGKAMEDVAPLVEDFADEMSPLVEDLLLAGVEGIPGFVDGLGDMAKELPAAIKFMQDLATAGENVASFLDDLADPDKNGSAAVNDFLFGKGREDRIKWAEDTFSVGSPMADKIKQGMEETGAAAGDKLSTGIQGKSQAVEAGFLGVTSPMAQKVRAQLDADMRAAGEAAAEGLAAGIEAKQHVAALRAREMARGVRDVMRQELKIASPSKVMEELGGFVGEGFALGIDGTKSKVDSSMRSLVSVPSITANVQQSVSSRSAGTARDGRLAEVVNFYETVSADATAMAVARRQNALGAV